MDTLSPSQLAALTDAGAIQAARAVADGRRWRLEVRAGMHWQLVATRRGRVRYWSRLDSLAGYLRRFGIGRWEVEAAGWTPEQAELPNSPRAAL